jgi:hypothetical protein
MQSIKTLGTLEIKKKCIERKCDVQQAFHTLDNKVLITGLRIDLGSRVLLGLNGDLRHVPTPFLIKRENFLGFGPWISQSQFSPMTIRLRTAHWHHLTQYQSHEKTIALNFIAREFKNGLLHRKSPTTKNLRVHDQIQTDFISEFENNPKPKLKDKQEYVFKEMANTYCCWCNRIAIMLGFVFQWWRTSWYGV